MRGPARERIPLFAGYYHHRFLWLFISLLVTLAVGSALHTLPSRYNPLGVLLGVNLLAAVASVDSVRDARLLVVVALGLVTFRTLRLISGSPGELDGSELFWVIGIVLTTIAAVRHALRPGAVDVERILAALDAYLLAGLLFGVAYWVIERHWPGSFGGPASGAFDVERAIYFSFVTIATLGYGDVVPVSDPARGLAIVEAVSGQMYLAVLVARLVSLFSQQRDD